MPEQDPSDARARRSRFEQTMLTGAQQYQDVLDRLQAEGLDGVFTQTGGMNAAIEITLDGGIVLITDAEDALSWDRNTHEGWLVGLYAGSETGDGPIRHLTTDDGSVEGLMSVLQKLLLAGRSN